MLIRSNKSRNTCTCIYKGYRFERESILDVRKHFKPTESFQNTEFPPVTLWASGKGSLKVKLKDFLELTLQRKHLKITLGNSNESYEGGVIQITFQRRFFQKLNSAKDHRHYKINKRHARMQNYNDISCDSGQGTTDWHYVWWSTISVLTLDKIKMMAVSIENYN